MSVEQKVLSAGTTGISDRMSKSSSARHDPVFMLRVRAVKCSALQNAVIIVFRSEYIALTWECIEVTFVTRRVRAK